MLEIEPGRSGHARDQRLLHRADPDGGRPRHGDRLRRVNSATGPIAVRGAEPGDSLVVELLEVRPDDRGFATLIPGMGQLIEQVQSPLTHVFRVEGDTIHMTDRISFPLVRWSA